MKTLTDTVKRVIFYSDKTNYIVLKTSNGSTLSGVYENGDLSDVNITVTGDWKNHKTYGNQFCFTSLEIAEDPLFYFLSKVVKGIGPKLAKEIINKFGSKKTEQILNENPTMLRLVKGIKKQKIEKIKKSWAEFKHIKEVTEFLTPYGVTSTMVLKIFNHFQEKMEKLNFNLVNEIKNNIYVLTQVQGIGFKKADEIALSSGIDPFDKNRIEACIEFIIFDYTKNEGNSCIDAELLKDMVIEETAIREVNNKTIKLDGLLVYQSISKMVVDKTIAALDETTVTLPFLEFAEENILSILSKKSNYKSGLEITSCLHEYIAEKEKELGFSFSDDQKEAIVKVNEDKKAFILYGYAGTGKSTISKAILDLLSKQYYHDKILCCALSGIASDRIRKTTGYEAATIQSLLVKYKATGEPLDCDVLLIDEASMVNSEIMYRIIKAVPEKAVIILVGDPAQLPPIGAGNPFSDLIDSRQIAAVELTQIYRQSEDSVITLFANQIREACIPDGFLNNNYSDWSFREINIKDFWGLKMQVKNGELPKKVLEEVRTINNTKILNEITNIAITYSRQLQTFLYDKKLDQYITSFQIIAPMKAGILGVENINKVIQSTINPRNDKKYLVDFKLFKIKLYDKVIHVVNRFMQCNSSDAFKNGREMNKRKIFNGMLGVVFKIDHEDRLIHIYYPNDDLVVEYSFEEAKEIIKLAYALTSHKTQGSQFATVVIPMTFSHYVMSNVKLLYTAITRAEDKLILVGEKDAFKTGCKRVDVVTRDTIIKRKIEKKEESKLKVI